MDILNTIMNSMGAILGIGFTLCISVVVIGVVGFVFYRVYQGRAQANALLQNGVPALATIVSIQDTGWRINDQPQALVTLQVTPADRPPFQAVVKDTFDPFELGSLVPGAPAQVRFNPNDTTKVAIESLGAGMTASINNMIASNAMAQNMMPGSVPVPGQFTPKFAPPPPMPPGAPAMTTADGQPLNPQLQAAMVTQDQYYMQLQQTGIEAKAVVLMSSNMNIRNYNTGWVYDITLDVTAPTGEHFQSKTQAAIVDTSQHKYAVGKMVIVRFDPNNKAQCTLVRAVES
jgi:hypothetical protein